MRAVLLKGVLKGRGREERCEFLAWTEAFANAPVYSQCRVVTASLGLPDGAYELSFDGRIVPARKDRGWWLMETLEA